MWKKISNSKHCCSISSIYNYLLSTANIYSHIDAVTKADTGAAMSKALG